jgi:hypothetical protein
MRKEENMMAGYLAWRIELGKLNYNAVVAKFPEFKDEIDFILASDSYIVNADGTVSKTE